MTLTKEQIEEIMGDRSVNEVCSDAEFIELCRMALSSISAEPMAWCVVYEGPPTFGKIHSDPTMYKPTAEAIVKNGAPGLSVAPLYAAPPDAERLREALVGLMGTEAVEEKIGWRGSNPPSNEHFSCEFCGESHLDFTLIPHLDNCPILAARAALEPK